MMGKALQWSGRTAGSGKCHEKIAENLIGINVFEQAKIDQLLMELDRTENKSGLGAKCNARCVTGSGKGGGRSASEFRCIPIWEEQMQKRCRFR